MVTARTLVTRALRHLGVTAAGEVPTADEAEDALSALNAMMESWSLDNHTIISSTLTIVPLQGGKETYTIGSGGEIDMTWPLKIDQAQLIVEQVVPNLDLPLRILAEQEYGLVRIKQLESTYPQALWLHTTYPLGTLHLWPVPTQGNSLRLWTMATSGTFATLDTDLTLGRGYQRALQYNLEMELAEEHGRPVTLGLARLAHNSLLAVKRGNTRRKLSYVDVPAGVGRDLGSYNWLTDRGAT